MKWARERDYDADVHAAASAYGVSPALIKAVIAVESGFNPAAINRNDPGYAWGLMQMIPTTARGLGFTGPMDTLLTDTTTAIRLGAALLRENLDRAGTVQGAVSAYNGGYRPALGYGKPSSTGVFANQAYVNRVMAEYAYFGAEDSGPVVASSGGGDVAQAGVPFPGGGNRPGGDAVGPVETPVTTGDMIRWLGFGAVGWATIAFMASKCHG